jgi:hypothetical protein
MKHHGWARNMKILPIRVPAFLCQYTQNHLNISEIIQIVDNREFPANHSAYSNQE